MTGEQKLRAYVINLDRSPDRLKRFTTDNTMPGLEIVRFPGIDGKSLDRPALVARNVIAGDLLYSNNAVGCALSHIGCWEQIIKDGKPAVVCEDDAMLRKDFVTVHSHFAKVVNQMDVVWWSINFGLHMTCDVPGLGEFNIVSDDKYLDSEKRIANFQANKAPTMLFRPKRIWGLACYTVTPKGAEKLKSLVLPLRNGRIDTVYRTGLWMQPRKCTFPNLGIDVDVGLVHIGKLNARVAVPPIAVHRMLDTASTIDTGREEERYQAPFVDNNGRLHVPVPLTTANVVVINQTGLALHDFKRYELAIRYFDRALQLRADVPELHYNRGNALIGLRRFEEAVASYDKAIAAKADYASAHNNRGFALQHLGRIAEAIASYDKVLALQPAHPRAGGNRDALVKRAAQESQALEGKQPVKADR